jgi:hypothetical protein
MRQFWQPVNRWLEKLQSKRLSDVMSEQRFAIDRYVFRRNLWDSPTVDADDIPFLGDAGAPKFLSVVGLAGGEEQGRHELGYVPLFS